MKTLEFKNLTTTVVKTVAGFWKTNKWTFLSQLFLVLFLITFPFQIRTLIYATPLYQSGEFNFFTSFFVYGSDLFFFLAFLFWGMSLYKKEPTDRCSIGEEKMTFLVIATIFLMIGYVFIVQDSELHFMITFRFIELFLLYLMITNKILKHQHIVLIILTGLGFQSFIAIYQYLTQGSLGLTILGEPIATATTLGVAKISMGSVQILRAFGTMPHANVLGGLLFMGIMYSLAILRRKHFFVFCGIFLLAIALLFTFSRSAFFALITAFLVYISIQNTKESKKVLKYSLLVGAIILFVIVVLNLEDLILKRLFFEDTSSSDERMMYLRIARDMIFNSPFGVGMGGFTIHMQEFTTTKLVPWIIQPVHNIFLLMMNELGALGGILFASLFGYTFYQLLIITRKQRILENRRATGLLLAMLCGIIVIGMFDHYFITIYQAQVMLFIYLGFVSSLLKNDRLPAKNS